MGFESILHIQMVNFEVIHSFALHWIQNALDGGSLLIFNRRRFKYYKVKQTRAEVIGDLLDWA